MHVHKLWYVYYTHWCIKPNFGLYKEKGVGCLGTILVAASTYFIKQGRVKLHQTEILNSVATLTEINLVNIHTLSQSLQIAMYRGIVG